MYEYYYTVQFKLGDQEVIGTIKAPKTLESDEEILHYLKKKIEKEKGYGFDTTSVSSELKGKKFRVIGERKISWPSWTVPEKTAEPAPQLKTMTGEEQKIQEIEGVSQEQQTQIEELWQENEEIKDRLAALENMMEKIDGSVVVNLW